MISRFLAAAALCAVGAAGLRADDVLPKFKDQVIDPAVGVGYAISVADINADGKPDIVVVTEIPDQVVWYENPTWKKRVIVAKEPKLPVCIQPLDVDGDGKTELILGADWQPSNTKTGGSVWLLKRPADLDQPWTPIKIDEEPSMHRMRVIDVDGSGRKELVCSTLQGRDTKGPDWLGNGASLYILRRPQDPFTQKWVREVISNDLHAKHNCWPIDWDGDGKQEILTASFEGVFLFKRTDGKWGKTQLGSGNQVSKPNRGSSEIKVGALGVGKRFLATTEPWHGHQAVVYTQGSDPAALWTRTVLVENHKGGHAVWAADLTGTGTDSLVVGFRGPPEGKPGEWVVYLFHPIDAAAGKWEKAVLDSTGMGSEDIVCADFDGDGKVDIAATGRGTKNVKIYWNQRK